MDQARVSVAVRADASTTLGSGHVMRCLTLAAVLRARGAEVVFFCAEQPGDRCTYIERQSFRVVRLPAFTDAAADLRHMQAALADEAVFDWLVVDHYRLDAAWERGMRHSAAHILVIDDLADRSHDCDLLLDSSPAADSAQRYAGLLPPACRTLFGPRYALLRPEFAAGRTRRERRGALRRVLVTFGGSDPANLTVRALEAMESCGDLAVDVVVGSGNPHIAQIEAHCARLPQACLHRDADNMAQLMAEADLVVGAGGSTLLECCCVGVPALTVCGADNQHRNCDALAAAGAHFYLGEAEVVQVADIAVALAFLRRVPELRAHVAEQASGLCDGRGALRVVRAMLPEQGVRIRPAVAADCDVVWAWRNAPEVRRHSGDAAPIPLEDHRLWFAAALQDVSRVLLIGEDGNGAPVGVLRYDLEGDSATVSVYLVPGREGLGLGAALLVAGEAWLRQRHAQVKRLLARVRPTNTTSVALFSAMGYSAHHTDYIRKLQ